MRLDLLMRDVGCGTRKVCWVLKSWWCCRWKRRGSCLEVEDRGVYKKLFVVIAPGDLWTVGIDFSDAG